VRVVIDTNVFLSAIISPEGTTSQVMNAWYDNKFSLVMSHRLLGEIKGVLSRDKHAALRTRRHDEIQYQYSRIEEFARFFDENANIVTYERDPKDTMILALAVSSAADCIVSGDRDLQDLEKYQDIPILSPRQFLDFLEAGSDT